uniref:BED-type domain-containing protein n=1 Tax=Fagus sylvatica TaxID=28930 RepID=A0A2N9ITI2_FAGSY
MILNFASPPLSVSPLFFDLRQSASTAPPAASSFSLQAFNQLQSRLQQSSFSLQPSTVQPHHSRSELQICINMAENSFGSSTASAPARSDDPAWAHARVVPEARNNTICLYCNKLIKGGGITRLKYHLAGIRGQVESCKSAPDDVKWQMKQLVEDLNKSKQTKRKINAEIARPYGDPIDIDEEEEEEGGDVVARSVSQSVGKRDKGKGVQSTSGKKGSGIQNYFAPRTTPGAQPSIKSALSSKAMVDKAKMAWSKWWFDSNISFNAANSVYYQPAIDAIASIGPGFKGPTYQELRGPLLRNNVREVNDFMVDIKNDWKEYGCSVMSDGWTNQKQQPIMNFLVYCPRGTMFLKSLDTSGLRKDAETLFGIFDTVVQEIGVEYIVQFITDNDSSYKAAGKKLMMKYPALFWSPCAAHCLDLMLENIADRRYFPIIDDTVRKAKHVTKYIYNHGWVLDLMRREYTNDVVGKEVAKIVLEDHEFWSQCHHIVKVTEPLVRVLRLVDGDEKPAMGYLYEAMDRAKEEIKVRMKHKVSLYGPYVQVINARWDKQLYSHLHAAGCFLNPAIYFRPTFTKKNEVHRGLISTIMRLVRDPEIQDKISSQLDEYKKSIGDFGMSLAIRQREKLNPVSWWEQFGLGTPELRTFAIRVLSQCCSATGCERNWSIFEDVHSKRRNRLEHKRTNDLVFVRYNLKLRERNIRRTKNTFDPISLDNIDLMAEWVAEEPGLLDEDDLNLDNLDAPIAPMNVEDDDEVIVLNEDITEDDQVVKENHRRVLGRSFDTPCDTPADSVNPFAVDADDAVDDNDVFDFGEFDK